MRKTIEEEFSKRDKFFDVRLNYKLQALEELLAPLKLQLIRSMITVRGYDANNEYREKILKECNETMRSLLLTKGHLIPSDLIPSAEEFIKHFDGWLQAYNKFRVIKNDTNVKLVFTYDFPHNAEKAFSDKCESYRKELAMEGSLN